MEMAGKTAAFAALRQRIRQMERLEGAQGKAGTEGGRASLALLAPHDGLWPEKGLPLGCLHEAGGDGRPAGFAALTAFAAALAGRLGAVLWCSRRAGVYGPSLYGPGLAQVGLRASRLIAATTASDAEVLAVMEEGLRHPVLACVVGEVGRINLTASRRLQLAAEKSGVTAFVLRTLARQTTTEPLAAASRWRISAMPSTPHVIPEAGRARWRLELLQSRCGARGDWIVEAPDAQGYLHLPSPLADGIAKAPAETRPRMAKQAGAAG